MHKTSIDTDGLTGTAPDQPVDDFQRALASREDIDQAKGILIALYRVSGETAWQMLSTASQHWNIKVRLLAAVLVEIMTGATPRDASAADIARQLLPPSWIRGGGSDLSARDRRLLGDERDRFAVGRDVAAASRDEAADVRDAAVGRPGLAAGAAADRAAARRDRRSAEIDREVAAEDRIAAEAESR